MTGFLIVHVLHKRSEMRMGFDNWRGLSGVNEGGGEFAGLVYTQRAVKEASLLLG